MCLDYFLHLVFLKDENARLRIFFNLRGDLNKWFYNKEKF